MMNSRRVLALLVALALLGTGRYALGYDATRAVKHARDHWAAYDPAYHDYSSISGIAALGLVFSGTFHHGDCTNFTSQNMIAGGLNVSNGPGVDDRGSIPLLTNLVTNLEASQHIKKTARIDFRVTQTAPDWLVPGDIVTWGDDTAFYRHSGTVVGGQGKRTSSGIIQAKRTAGLECMSGAGSSS